MNDSIDNEWNKEFSYDGNGNKKKNQKLIEDASEEIISKYSFITIEETDEIWYYKEGVYVTGGEILIGKESENTYGYELDTAKLAQIIGHIKRRTYHKQQELDADINIINLKNGLYDIDKNQLYQHDPKYLSLNQKPITYVKGAKSKRFGSFLREVLYPRDIRTAVEAMAYTFHRDYDVAEIIFYLYGLGLNGKSVYTSTLTALHGTKSVSNVPFSDMLSDKFAISDLEGKDINIDNELVGETIKETAVLKRITGGSRQPIRIQRKNQRAHDTILYAKLFFNANKIPDSGDTTDAYNRRVAIIAFPNRFENSTADKYLIQKLTADEEKTGIFNVLMIALRRIRAMKDVYVNEKTVEEKRIKYQRAHNPVKAFLEEAIDEESTEDNYISKADFHIVYIIYCEKYGLPTEKYDSFCKLVKKNRSEHIHGGSQIGETRKDLGEKNAVGKSKLTYCWTGVKLTKDYTEFLLTAKGAVQTTLDS